MLSFLLIQPPVTSQFEMPDLTDPNNVDMRASLCEDGLPRATVNTRVRFYFAYRITAKDSEHAQ